MDKKIISVSIVVIVVVAAVAAVVIVNNDGEKEYEYDPAKGWYSWDPIAFETKSAYITLSPGLVDGIEKMYAEIYGDEVDYSGYTIADVPSDFMKYDSLVTSVTDDTVVIDSTVREKSTSTGKVTVPTTVNKCPDNLLCTGGYAAILEALLEYKYSPSSAVDKLWDYVYALDKSALPGGSADIEALYGLKVPSDIVSVNSTYSLITNLEKYVDYVDGGTQNGETFVMLAAGALGNDYSELSPFYDLLESKNGAASAVFFYSNNITDVLAALDALGAIYDLQDEAQEIIDEWRLKFYAIQQEALDEDENYKVYLESNTGTAAGSGTITSDAFSLLNMVNINTTASWQKIPEETIIEEMPDVIIFYDTNTKSWDERMRVGIDPASALTN